MGSESKTTPSPEFIAAIEEAHCRFSVKDALPYVGLALFMFSTSYYVYIESSKAPVNGADLIMNTLESFLWPIGLGFGMFFVVMLLVDIRQTNERAVATSKKIIDSQMKPMNDANKSSGPKIG